MKLFELFHKKPEPPETLCWSWLDNRTSIYRFLVDGLDEDGRLMPDRNHLPDERFVRQRGQLIRVAGARDGYLLFHTHRKGHPRQVEEILRVFSHAADTFAEQDVAHLYEILLNCDLMPSLDLLIDQLSRYPLDPGRTFALAAQLALRAADRQPLKFALTVLSFYQLPEVRALSLLFSQHDEFTYFALLCLMNFEDRFQQDCWMVAQSVHGWGRIHAVETLVPTLRGGDDALRDWLLREGFHNTVGDGYLAHRAVEHGRLLERLSVPDIDRGLLQSSGIIIAALLDPQCPGEDLSACKDSPQLVLEYLRHLSQHRQLHMHQPTLLRLKELIGEILSSEQPSDFARSLIKKGWNEEVLHSMTTALARLNAA